MAKYRAGFWPAAAQSSAESVRASNAVEEAEKADIDKLFDVFLDEAKEKGLDPVRRRAVFFSWLQDKLGKG